jgi:hypothetical protein
MWTKIKLGTATYYQKPAVFLLRVVSVMTFWGEGGCVVASLGPSPPFNGPGRLRDPRRRSNEVSRCPSAWSPRGHQAVTPGSIMPTEQLTYAQIAKHLSVSPEAARAIVKRHRLPRSRRNDGKTLAAIDLKEIKHTPPSILPPTPNTRASRLRTSVGA